MKAVRRKNLNRSVSLCIIMYTIVLDSDGFIKLLKAGLPFGSIGDFKFVIPEEVFEEVVTEGKKGLHEDAFIAEGLINRKMIVVVHNKEKIRQPDERLGKGELAAKQTFSEQKAFAILSDDKQFIERLLQQGIPFITTADFIVLLAERKAVSVEEAKVLLGRLRPFIDDERYGRMSRILEGK